MAGKLREENMVKLSGGSLPYWLSLILKRFGDQAIELSCFGVSFNLLIPEASVELKEPGSELGEIFRGKALDLLFKLLKFAHGRSP